MSETAGGTLGTIPLITEIAYLIAASLFIIGLKRLSSPRTARSGNVIGAHFQTGNKVNIRESNRIGDNVSIGTLSVIEHHVEIDRDYGRHERVVSGVRSDAR